ncbi:hemerythrin domain-containing protein [Streptomyces wuyuanensis]|uniref:hemerythrin domain-containing protein n=1 Tax=Streptomyces wuyuanensis TaxID=1196353 RepID=UPI00380BF6C8
MTTHDVVELILDDHRTMEDLLRRMRSIEADRAKALREFSRLLIAHGEAEESEVYPALRRYKRIDDDEVDHGEEEHADGNKALLALLEVDDVGGDEWDEKLENLVEAVSHHLDEEERTLLNEARRHVPEERRAELGEAFLRERADLLASDCGNAENVRRLLKG